MPSSLLALEPTTLFFYTLSSSRQHHETSVENWRSTIEKSLDPVSKTVRSSTIPTAPPLTYTTTHPSSTSNSKRRSVVDDSLIDLSGPTPKKPRTYPPKRIVDNTVRITLNDDEFEDKFHGGMSDWDEMDGPEAIAARNSPPKNGARATSSVRNS
jgi:hypothetical protein